MELDITGTDQEYPLWRDFRNGDPKALAAIFTQHYDSLYAYGRKLTNDVELVQDCMQNLFLKLWTSRDRLAPISNIRPYLLKALRRHIGDQIMAINRKRKMYDEAADAFPITFSHEDFLISLQASRQQSERLARSLNALSPRKREAIFLRFYEGLDYTRIAEIMSLNVQSVRNLIYQSLQTIKEQMDMSVYPSFIGTESESHNPWFPSKGA